ncbi:MAG: hypothetical protein FWC40_00670 [Proteobacteria bacterium]|nr:hypothetical protein [Pseudomonadota bacterium]
MVRKNFFRVAMLMTSLGVFGLSGAHAAEITDVLDAADYVYLENQKVDNLFDIALTPAFKQQYEWAKLKREYNDTASSSTRLLNELQYERVVNSLDIDLAVGLFHDLEFRMTLPIILSDQQSYKFDTTSDNPEYQIDKGKSWFSPSTLSESRPYSFFDLDDGETLKGRERSGLGDIKFGIAWSPYNAERHFIPERPWENNTGRSTMTVAFDYVAPTGKARAIDNSGVGSGVHEFIFSVAASRRYKFVDPYIGLQFGVPHGVGDVFKDFGHNQARKDPGLWGRVDLGVEFIPYESLKLDYQRLVKIDLRAFFTYTGEGRNFSELMDAFGTGSCYQADSATNLGAGCGWVAEKWSNAGVSNIRDMADGLYRGPLKEDGIFDYEGFATIGGSLSLIIQPIQYIQIRAGVAASYMQDHFVTFTKVGKDRVTYDPDTGAPVPGSGKDGVVTETLFEERNPTYSGALDRVGNRIKRTESLNLDWFVGIRVMY